MQKETCLDSWNTSPACLWHMRNYGQGEDITWNLTPTGGIEMGLHTPASSTGGDAIPQSSLQNSRFGLFVEADECQPPFCFLMYS